AADVLGWLSRQTGSHGILAGPQKPAARSAALHARGRWQLVARSTRALDNDDERCAHRNALLIVVNAPTNASRASWSDRRNSLVSLLSAEASNCAAASLIGCCQYARSASVKSSARLVASACAILISSLSRL